MRRGLIPAHAGKTKTGLANRKLYRAHPRSRGENSWLPSCVRRFAGSSPLTRGKLSRTGVPWLIPGLIPAHAGKIVERVGGYQVLEAHPRSRGENKSDTGDGSENWGSSPLTRGKYFLTCAFIAQIGQILESRELCASSESYSLRNVYATAAPQDQVRSIGLAPLSSRGAS